MVNKTAGKTLISVMLFFLTLSCADISKDLNAAKSALEKARQAEAPVYAPKIFGEAEQDYDQANRFASERKKKEAVEKARSSQIKSGQAYESAVRERARVIYREDAKLMEQAQKNKAGDYFPADFSQCAVLYTNLTTQYTASNYLTAYATGTELKTNLLKLNGMVLAEQTRREEETRINEDSEQIYRNCEKLLGEARTNGAPYLAAMRYRQAEQDFHKLEASRTAKNHEAIKKGGTTLTAQLEDLIRDCREETEATRNRIRQAQQEYDQAEQDKAIQKLALTELRKALPELKAARDNIAQWKMKEADKNAENARRIIGEARKLAQDKGKTDSAAVLKQKEKERAQALLEEAKYMMDKVREKYGK